MKSVTYFNYINRLDSLKTSLHVEFLLANELIEIQSTLKGSSSINIDQLTTDKSAVKAYKSIVHDAGLVSVNNDNSYAIIGENLKKITSYKSNLQSEISRLELLKNWSQSNAKLANDDKGNLTQINADVNKVLSQLEDAFAFDPSSTSIGAGRTFQSYISKAVSINNTLLNLKSIDKDLYEKLIEQKIINPSLPIPGLHDKSEYSIDGMITQIHDTAKNFITSQLGGVDKYLERRLAAWENDSKDDYGDSVLRFLNSETMDANPELQKVISQGNKLALLTKFTQDNLNGLDEIVRDHTAYGHILHNTTSHLGALKFGSFVGKAATTGSTLLDSIEVSVLDSDTSNLLQAARFVSDYLGFSVSTARGFYTSYQNNGDLFHDLKKGASDLKKDLTNTSSNISESIKNFLNGSTVLKINPHPAFKDSLRFFTEDYISSPEGWKLSSKNSALKNVAHNPFGIISDSLLLGSSVYSLIDPKQSVTDTALNSLSLVGTGVYAASDVLSLLKGKNFTATSDVLGVIGGGIFLGLAFKNIYDIDQKYLGDYSSRLAKFELGNSIVQATAASVGVALSLANPIFALPLVLIPNFSAIGTALDIKDAENKALKDGDTALAQVLEIMHKGAALDSTPIINWFSAGYDASFKNKITDLQNTDEWQRENFLHQAHVLGEKMHVEIAKLKSANGLDNVSYISTFASTFANPFNKTVVEYQGPHYLLEVEANSPTHSKNMLPKIKGLKENYDLQKTIQKGNSLTILDLTNTPLDPIDPRQVTTTINLKLDFNSDSHTSYYVTKRAAEPENHVKLNISLTDVINKQSMGFFNLTPDAKLVTHLKDITIKNQSPSSIKTVLDLSNVNYSNDKDITTNRIDLSSRFDIVYGPTSSESASARPLIYYYFQPKDFADVAANSIGNGTLVSKGYTDIYVKEKNSHIYVNTGDTVRVMSSSANVHLDGFAKSVRFEGHVTDAEPAGHLVSASLFKKGIDYRGVENGGILSYKHIAHNEKNHATSIQGATKLYATDFDDHIEIVNVLAKKASWDQIDYISLGKGKDTLEVSKVSNLTVIAGDKGDEMSFHDTSFLNLQLNQGSDQLTNVKLSGTGHSTSINVLSGKTTVKNDVNSEQSNLAISTGGGGEYLGLYSGKGDTTIYVGGKSGNNLYIVDNYQRSGAIKIILKNPLDYAMTASSITAKNPSALENWDLSTYLQDEQPIIQYSLTNTSERSTITIFTHLVNSAPIILSDNLHQDALIGISNFNTIV